MTSDDVTAEHSRRIGVWLIPALMLFTKLRERMVAKGFPPNDPLMLAVVQAHESVRQLRAKLHTIEVYRGENCPSWLRANRG